jgi:serine/threonine-protein kinase
VIKGTTNLDLLPADLNPSVRVIRRCLEKDLKKRFRDIGDVRYELAEVLAGENGPTPEPRMRSMHSELKWKRWWIAASLIAVIVAGVAGWSLRPLPRPGAARVHRFHYDLPEGQLFRGENRRNIAISRDGSRFVYNALNGLYLRSMDNAEAKLIAGTDELSVQPFFSPDGEWIGYWSPMDGQLKKIPLGGGAAVPLCSVQTPFGATWSEDNTILYGQRDGIWKVSGNGGKPERILQAQEREQVDSAQLLPGGEWILFTSRQADRSDEGDILAASLKSGQRKTIWRGGSDGQYTSTGHLLYAVGDVLYAAPFDILKVEITGGQFPILEGVRRAAAGSPSLQAHYAFSDQGTLIYIPGGSTQTRERILLLAGRDGGVQRLGLPPKAYNSARLSPDGKKIVVGTEERAGNAIWIYDLSGTSDIRQLTLRGNNERPIWMPDSRRVTFASDQDGPLSIYTQAADGSGAPERLTTAEKGTEHWPESWSPDGNTLSFVVMRANDSGVWTLSADSHMAKVFADEPGSLQRGSTFSPDGRWIVYHSNESDRTDVYARAFPGGPKKRITQDGRANPTWPVHGSELFYSLGATGQLFARTISLNDGLTFGREQRLTLPRYAAFGNGIRSYDVSSDGQRFLMTVPAGEQTRPNFNRIDIVLNWFEELKQKVPVH